MVIVTADGVTHAFNDIKEIKVVYLKNTVTNKIVPVMMIRLKKGVVLVCPFEDEPQDGKTILQIEFDPSWLPETLGKGDD